MGRARAKLLAVGIVAALCGGLWWLARPDNTATTATAKARVPHDKARARKVRGTSAREAAPSPASPSPLQGLNDDRPELRPIHQLRCVVSTDEDLDTTGLIKPFHVSLSGAPQEAVERFAEMERVLAEENGLPLESEAQIRNGLLTASRMPGTGFKTLYVDGYLPTRITWHYDEDSGTTTCEPLILTQGQVVEGQVVDTAGRPVEGAQVSACRQRGQSDERGHFELQLPTPTIECEVAVRRQDGTFTATDAVRIELDASGAAGVTLVLPEDPVGGIGFRLGRIDENGVEVFSVMAGSPAEAAGLQKGDHIVSVDGISTEEITAYEFIALGTGPVGSIVELEVEHEGSTRTIRIRRWGGAE